MKWINVCEKLPDSEKMVLIWYTIMKVINPLMPDYYDNGRWNQPNVIYWMPLPELPESEQLMKRFSQYINE